MKTVLALAAAGVLAAPEPVVPVEEQARTDANVVFVTLDGVRWQEFFKNRPDEGLSSDAAPTFPVLWSRLASQGVVYGDPAAGSFMSVSNPVMISLPAYQSMMAGRTTLCLTNECGRIGVETLPERLVRESGLDPADVATFTSWDKIALAVESRPGSTFVSVTKGPPAPDAGLGADEATFPAALEYLRSRRPRFLYISLDSPDNWAHRGDYGMYLKALRRCDEWLGTLADALDGLGEYGRRTTLIATTDHGRGVGSDWKSHRLRPSAVRVWLYARGPRMPKGATGGRGSHENIRATIEALYGLKPCKGCAPALR